MTQPILSICICTLTKRVGLLAVLLRELTRQIEENNATDLVEFCIEEDNGELTTGTKRNKTYEKARGLYVLSHDDDDWPAPYYIKELLEAAKKGCDAIAMNGTMTTDGKQMRRWFISKDNPYIASNDKRGNIIYLRFHNHLSPIKREIATHFKFPDVSMAEDYAFALAVHKSGLIKTEAVIGTPVSEFIRRYDCIAEKPMYEYRYITKK